MSDFEQRNHDFSKGMADAQLAYIEAERRVVELEAENAKLRELVRDMWRAGAFEPGACYVDDANRLEERTRELGIEVDHGN